MTDQELKDLVASLAISQAKTDAQMRETDAQMKALRESQAKTDAQMQKTDEQMKKTDERFEDLRASNKRTDERFEDLRASNKRTDERFEDLRASNKRTDERFEDLRASNKRTDERFEDLRASNKRMGILLGNISNNQGDVAEEFFYNSLENKMNLGGIHYDFIDQNWKRSNKALCDEFDIIMVNGKDIAIIEVKYKAHEKDLEKLLTKKQENFRELFPIYKDYTHHLALASFYMPPELKEKALENNVIVLQRKGDVMETFLPKNP